MEQDTMPHSELHSDFDSDEGSGEQTADFIKSFHNWGLLIVCLFVLVSVLFEHNLAKIVTFIVRLLAGPGKKEAKLVLQIASLHQTLTTISMCDEFAKHAKVQRQINKLTKEKDSYSSQRNMKGLKIRFVAPIALHILRGMISSMVVYNLWRIPLIVLTQNWFGPLYFITSLPLCEEGTIGVLFLMPLLYFAIRQSRKKIFH